jgi:hypothetical protein
MKAFPYLSMTQTCFLLSMRDEPSELTAPSGRGGRERQIRKAMKRTESRKRAARVRHE